LNEVPPGEESKVIHDSLAEIARATGVRPAGWLGSGLQETWDTLDLLAAEHPDDRVLSEESADDPRRLDADRVWIVDPLDGTVNYANGIPFFCVSVGTTWLLSPVR